MRRLLTPAGSLLRHLTNAQALRRSHTIARHPLAATSTRHFRLTSSSSSSDDATRRRQRFHYFLVLDFEATCERDCVIEPQEIIEFPVLKVCGQTFETLGSFHSYVKPKYQPTLSPFCTKLTGIIQDMVDDQPEFTQVLLQFEKWMEDEGVLSLLPTRKVLKSGLFCICRIRI